MINNEQLCSTGLLTDIYWIPVITVKQRVHTWIRLVQDVLGVINNTVIELHSNTLYEDRWSIFYLHKRKIQKSEKQKL